MSTQLNKLIDTTKKKFAVLIGINYIGTQNALSGCINDVYNLKKFLIEKCNFKESEILVLVDDGSSPTGPTLSNINNAMTLMTNKANIEKCEFLWLSYSGHGSYVRDLEGDEIDGYDEVWCPVDFSRNGFITDDFIYTNLICKLPQNCTLVTLSDSCHSGTILDLPFTYDKTEMKQTSKNRSHVASVISISGCMDHQTSADAFISGKYQGAMTWSFLSAVKNNNYNMTVSKLINDMRDLLKKDGYDQYPLLGLTDKAILDTYFINNTPTQPTSTPTPTQPTSAPTPTTPVQPTQTTPVQSQPTQNVQPRTITIEIIPEKNFRDMKWNLYANKLNRYVFPLDQVFTRPSNRMIRTITLPPGDYKFIITNLVPKNLSQINITSGNKPDNKVLLSSKHSGTTKTEFSFVI